MWSSFSGARRISPNGCHTRVDVADVVGVERDDLEATCCVEFPKDSAILALLFS